MSRKLGWIWIGALVIIPVLLVTMAGVKAVSGARATPPLQLGGEVPTVVGRTPPPGRRLVEPLFALPATADGQSWARSDLSHRDLTGLDLSQKGDWVRDYATFDSATRWPKVLPAGFDPAAILELGKDPGLGLRTLHSRGMTGKGVRIAILNNTLLLSHHEYFDRIKSYTEIGQVAPFAELSGAWITSGIAGRNTGVAPEAEIDYYAVQVYKDWQSGKRTVLHLAQAIHTILEENRRLPASRRVRVIVTDIGADSTDEGYAELYRAYEQALTEGVLVATPDMLGHREYMVLGLRRQPDADPNRVESYRPGPHWTRLNDGGQLGQGNWVGVPMEARTVAAETGNRDYRFYRLMGEGVTRSYLAGVYVLAVQLRPEITPEAFWGLATETAARVAYQENGQQSSTLSVLNPTALLEAVERLPR